MRQNAPSRSSASAHRGPTPGPGRRPLVAHPRKRLARSRKTFDEKITPPWQILPVRNLNHPRAAKSNPPGMDPGSLPRRGGE